MNTPEALELYQKVFDSGVFGKSQRQAKLLKFLLLHTVDGNSDRVNETTIAIDVFERGANFDATTDSIVRVEMHRLRKHLSLFNSHSNVQIELPLTSYTLAISTKQTAEKTEAEAKPPSDTKKTSIISTVILCLLAVFIWRQSLVEHLPPLKDSFRPRVQLVTDISNASLKKHLSMMITQALSSDNGLYVSNSSAADYRMLIQEDSGQLLLELWSTQDRLVHSQTLDISQLNQTQITSKVLWLIRLQFVQDTRSKMVLDYASASWVDPRKKKIHRCLMDSQSLIGSIPTTYYSPKEVPKCLSKLSTEDTQDQARISLDLALLAMQQARGYYNLGIENPLKVAKQETHKAQSILGLDRMVLVNRIYFYWVNGVVPGETKNLIETSKAVYPNDEVLAYMRSVTSTLYLNQWDSLDPLVETMIPELQESSRTDSLGIIPLARSVLTEDEEGSLLWLTKVNSSAIPYSLWGLSIGCMYNKPTLVSTQQDYLRDAKIETFSLAIKTINSLKYSPELTSALTQALEKCSNSDGDGW